MHVADRAALFMILITCINDPEELFSEYAKSDHCNDSAERRHEGDRRNLEAKNLGFFEAAAKILGRL